MQLAWSQATWPSAVLSSAKPLSSTGISQKYVPTWPVTSAKSPQNQRARSIRWTPWSSSSPPPAICGIGAPLAVVAGPAAVAVARPDVEQLADLAGVEQGARLLEGRVEAVVEPDLDDDALPLGGVQQRPELGGVAGGRLLDQDVLAGLDGGQRGRRQHVVRRRHDDGVDVWVLDRLAEVVGGDAARVLGRAARSARPSDEVGAGDQPVRAERRRALAADQPAADDGDLHGVSQPRSSGTIRRRV